MEVRREWTSWRHGSLGKEIVWFYTNFIKGTGREEGGKS
jgi:hypothetical protein